MSQLEILAERMQIILKLDFLCNHHLSLRHYLLKRHLQIRQLSNGILLMDIIYESNESNNFYYKNIIIPDYFPPPRPGLMAYPPVWASSVTRVVDISPPNTSDAIDHYEYMIDYGEYTNIGLNLSFVTPKKSNGEHILYVRAIDD